MCQPSKVYEDWVTKGFHIHIGRFEVVIRPTHTGGVTFKRWPPHSAGDADDGAVIRIAFEKYLPDPVVRSKWEKDLNRAIEFIRGSRYADPRLDHLRNGRQYEFHRLVQALRRYNEVKE